MDGMRSLITLPQYDGGESLNLSILLWSRPNAFDRTKLPMMVWQSNLFGRAILNLVLRQERDEAYRALDRELRIVGDLQKSLLPRSLPQIPGVDVSCYYQTSQRAGGDYYDFFPLPDGQWGLFIADVSGHGPAAAVVMAITHAIAHSHPSPTTPPSVVLSYVNRHLAQKYTGDTGTFVTAFYGVYDPASRQMTYASAGHNPPRWKRAGASVAGLDGEASLPLGIDLDETYPQHTATLSPGDVVAFYTDGITEARATGSGTLFGTERLDAVMAATNDSPEALVREILNAVESFTNRSPATDDRTLLVMKVR
jgi:sigma-B regulation protein RsbU (phosphoserine phosphatase)